jgi:hypothetical protein
MDYTELAKVVLSEKRLQKYGSLNPSNLRETFARYIWNIELCEALYPVLNSLEVALRNSIHRELAVKLKYTRWMQPERKLLEEYESNQVARTIARLRKAGKSAGVDQIIASLMLGFWVGLFAVGYEQKFWRGHSLKGVFRFAPKSELGCHSIRYKLNRIKYLRNRIFHHEPIWHWRDLDDTYRDIVCISSWLSQDWSRLMVGLDRFPAMLTKEYQPILAQLPPQSDCDQN